MDTREPLTVKTAKEILKTNHLIIPNAFAEYRKELEGFKNAAEKINESFRKQFEGIERVMKEFRESFKIFGEEFRPSLITLAEHGWYICGSSALTDSIKLARELKNKNIEKADKFLVDFYEEEFDHIIRNIGKSCPERVKIINEANKAHKNKMYYASTLLFLSTADGLFDGHLFKDSNKGKPNLKDKLDKIGHTKEFGELLLRMSAVDAVESKIKLFHNPLNRHWVMHGKDINYGNKINSLKALSLLAFICDFFEKRKNN